MDGTDIALRLVGAFYVFAGYVATRATLMSLVLDRAIAAIGATKPKRAELARGYWLLGAAFVVMAGGATLIALLDIACVAVPRFRSRTSRLSFHHRPAHSRCRRPAR